ncbi:MAG: hypothetical protein LUH19_01415 [Lachnospiraceae bacterium]|nr:hypothetical protein [Lachnospiraceae bacterium]
MATSSIFANFTITVDAVERFIEALEWSEKQPRFDPSTANGRIVTDPEEIRALGERWRARQELNGEN